MDTEQAPHGYQFVMDRWLPATIPMKRLAQYMDKMAGLLGSQDRVHFAKITKGSARPEFNVEEVVAFEVAQRLKAAANGEWFEGQKLIKDINRMLMEDGCVGYLRALSGPRYIEFPGRKTPIAQEVTVHESGELEGQIIRVGGKDDTVPVTLMGDGGVDYKCQTSRTIAKELAKLLFGATVRVNGKGKWRRNSEGVWTLEYFQIQGHEILDDVPLEKFVQEMRAIPGSGWNESEDPHADFKKLRED